jgi:hypothetical protein
MVREARSLLDLDPARAPKCASGLAPEHEYQIE